MATGFLKLTDVSQSSTAYTLVDETQVPDNFTTTGSILLVELYSGLVPASIDLFAKVIPADISSLGNATLGEDGYCSVWRPCAPREGDCDFHGHCNGTYSYCEENGCPAELGFGNGTECCIDTATYCSEFLTVNNSTLILQTPANYANGYLFEFTCKWYMDAGTNTYLSFRGSESMNCDATAEKGSCCTSDHPCLLGEGDCDSDSECQFGLTCGTDNCGPDAVSWMDCCEPQNIFNTGNFIITLVLQTFEVSTLSL